MLAYAASLALRLRGVRPRGPWIPARALWVAGCIVFLIHVGAAFYYFHRGSHAVAYEHTAQRTLEVVGFRWGGGLYFNYLFAVFWMIDAAWWLIDSEGYDSRPRFVDYGIHAFMFFMAFNAVVVFGPPVTRAVGVGACLGFWGLWMRRRRTRSNGEFGMGNGE